MKERVKIVEVGPRDGLQNEKTWVPTDEKLSMILKLLEAGLRDIEVTSFVKPSAIPQLKDSSLLFQNLKKELGDRFDHYSFPVLIPNMKGFERAKKVGVKEISLFTASSDSFTKKNINATVAESLQRFSPVIQEGKKEGMKIRGYLSTAFYCPYEGKVSEKRSIELVQKLLEAGMDEISIGDTVGMASPNEVRSLLRSLVKEVPPQKIGMHFHDTRGMAIANIYESLAHGIRIFDSSIGGLGGCPYAEGATGNVSTETVVFLLHRLGFKTGVNLEKIERVGEGLLNHEKNERKI